MKSNNTLKGIALVALVIAVASAATLWADIPSPVKIAMFALGFSAGIAVGRLIAQRAG